MQSLSILNRLAKQIIVNNSCRNSLFSINSNSSLVGIRSYCKKKHHHHGHGGLGIERFAGADEDNPNGGDVSVESQMRRADLLRKMNVREQQEADQMVKDEIDQIEEDDQEEHDIYEHDDDEYNEGFNSNEIKQKIAMRRKRLAIEDELESISRFGSSENKFHPDVLSPEQIERAVFGEDGKIIPPEQVTPRDMYLHLMRKYRGLKTKKQEEIADIDEDDELLSLKSNTGKLSEETKKKLIEKQMALLEKERLHEELVEKAEAVGAENIEKYRVNTLLEEMRANKQAKMVQDKSSTEYLLKHVTKLERDGTFNEPVTRSPTTGKEVVGNKKYPKCLLCYDYGWKVDPLNVPLLSIYINNDGDILPRYITGNCLKHQKKIATTIKQAKHLGLYSYKKGAFTIYDPNVVPPTPKEDAEYDRWYRGDVTDKDWIGDESIEEIDEQESPIDTEKEKLKQKESIMLDMGVSEHEADSILAGKFFKIKDSDSK